MEFLRNRKRLSGACQPAGGRRIALPTAGPFPCAMARVPLRAIAASLALSCAGASPVSAGAATGEPAAIWSLAADGRSYEAATELDRRESMDPRRRELAAVVIALARPPLAKGKLQASETALARLSAGTDETAAIALYLLARCQHLHRAVPDYGRAEETYRELARRWPGGHWADLGMVKLGLVKLYAPVGPVDPVARLAAAHELLAQVRDPCLRRDLQLQIGWAALFYERPYDEVLPDLIAADSVGGMLGITPEDLVIQIGELSFRAGHDQQAQRYFTRFLAEFPTNPRRFNVRQRLAEVEARLAGREAAR